MSKIFIIITTIMFLNFTIYGNSIEFINEKEFEVLSNYDEFQKIKDLENNIIMNLRLKNYITENDKDQSKLMKIYEKLEKNSKGKSNKSIKKIKINREDEDLILDLQEDIKQFKNSIKKRVNLLISKNVKHEIFKEIENDKVFNEILNDSKIKSLIEYKKNRLKLLTKIIIKERMKYEILKEYYSLIDIKKEIENSDSLKYKIDKLVNRYKNEFIKELDEIVDDK